MSDGAGPGHGQDEQATKAQLRARLRRERKERPSTMDPAVRAAAAADLSRHVREHLAAMHPAPRRVAAFESLPTEVPTEALLADLRAAGIEVLVPILLPDKDLDWTLQPHPAGQPAGAASDERHALGLDAIASCDLVFVPAMAVDHRGHRLGQGGGSYDRTLPRRRPGTAVVALVSDEEFLSWTVPTLPHDEPVDAVVTPGGGWRAMG